MTWLIALILVVVAARVGGRWCYDLGRMDERDEACRRAERLHDRGPDLDEGRL